MFLLKPIIYAFWGLRDFVNDPYKDQNDKGLNQRFIEYLAKGLDDNELADVNGLVTRTQFFDTMDEDFIPYHEQQRGIQTTFVDDTDIKIKILRWWFRIINRKGSIRGYIMMFKMQGYTGYTFTEHLPTYGFDNDPLDTFKLDDSCPTCSSYSIALTGSGTITQEQVYRTFRAIELMEPINAKLLSVTYNGDLIVEIIILVSIDEDGNLIYDNVYDPELELYIVDGDLIIAGPNAEHYYINDDGDLIYTIDI